MRQPITPDTVVAVTMLGEQQSYRLTDPAPLRSMANTLSDLTGFKVDHIVDTVIMEIGHTRNGVKLTTAAGDLCPVRFLVTVHGARRPESVADEAVAAVPFPVDAAAYYLPDRVNAQRTPVVVIGGISPMARRVRVTATRGHLRKGTELHVNLRQLTPRRAPRPVTT